MKPPIFVVVAANGDILAFDSPARAERYVESIDVENGEYLQAFDSEGRLLALEVERPTVRHKFVGLESVELTPVRLVEKESKPSHAEDLVEAEERGRGMRPARSETNVTEGEAAR